MTSRDARCELLAIADEAAVVELADRCLADGAAPEVLVAPEVGTVVLEVREPVEAIRFHLAEVLVTRAEVALDGVRGWAMRLGDEPAAALAAAICDAEAEAARPLANAIADLCARTDAMREAADAAEWAQLQSTVVRFEELDT